MSGKKKSQAATATAPQASEEDVKMTVSEAAALWGCHPSRVKQWVDEGRVKHEKVGGGKKRAGVIVIKQRERPLPKSGRKAAADAET